MPLLNGIEEKGYPPTLVHLQVYDGTWIVGVARLY